MVPALLLLEVASNVGMLLQKAKQNPTTSRSISGSFTRTRCAVIVLYLWYIFLFFSIMLKSQLNYGLWHGSILYTTAFHKTNEQGHWGSLSILSLKVYMYQEVYSRTFSFSIKQICSSIRQWRMREKKLLLSLCIISLWRKVSLRWLGFLTLTSSEKYFFNFDKKRAKSSYRVIFH